MKKLTRTLYCILLLSSLSLTTACQPQRKETSETPAKKTYIVIYEVTGTAESATITALSQDGIHQEFPHQELPWSKSFLTDVEDTLVLSVNAVADGMNVGTVTSSIHVNGKIIKTSTSSGPVATALANAYIIN